MLLEISGCTMVNEAVLIYNYLWWYVLFGYFLVAMASLQAIIFCGEFSHFTCFLPFLLVCITVVANKL